MPSASEGDLQKCSLVYVAGPQKGTRDVLDSLSGKSILTIGESDSFVNAGGMVALPNVGEHIQVHVNVEAIQHAGIKISPRLLNIAVIVRPDKITGSERAERKLLRHAPPEYPELAAKMSLHGSVKLKVLIAPDGTVRDLECVGGHPVLAASPPRR